MQNSGSIPALSQSQIDAFHSEGLLIVDFGFEDSILNDVIFQMLPKFENKLPDGSYRPGTRVQDGWKTSAAVKKLATDNSVLKGLEQLFGRSPKPFQTLNFPVGTEQHPHSDTVHFNSMPSGFMAGVWVALEDASEKNGTLKYYKGSHKLPEYNMQDFGLETGYGNYRQYEKSIQKIIEAKSLEYSFANLKKGQALIWHANLIHGGSKRKDSSTTRHSQVTHYFFEGCRYFTPMESSANRIAWRKPKWIPINYGEIRQK